MVEQIKSLCKNNKTSIKALEKALGFGNGTIRRWDTHSPGHDKIVKVAEYFNISIETLIGETDEKEKSPVVSNEASDIDIKILDALKQLSEEQKAQALDFALFLANNSKK